MLADQLIRETALDISRSFIVQAPAGSGKTTLLIKRFLKLLAEVDQVPEECLGITFTRKAAAEMKDRILQALQMASDMPQLSEAEAHYPLWQLAQKVLERDKQAGWALLQNPARLKIQTIDALCASITRQMPVISQFGAAPDIVEDPLPLYQTAARQFLKTLESKTDYREALSLLLEHLDNNLALAEHLLADMLSVREQWLPFIGYGHSVQPEAWRIRLEQGLKTAVEDTLFLATRHIPFGFENIISLAQFAAVQLEAVTQEKNKEGCSQIVHCRALSEQWPGHTVEDLPIWQGISELLLTDQNQFRKTVTQKQGFISQNQLKEKTDKAYFQQMKQDMVALLEQLTPYTEFKLALQRVRACPPLIYSDMEWSVVNAMVSILPVLVAHLIVVFQEEGKVDFSEVSLAARRALGDHEHPTDLALGLDYKIKHILVDEFQDTSIPQLKLLEQLTHGWQSNDARTLFLVGDPQQSIYRFRQAEVGLFLQIKHRGLGAVHLTPLTLSVNFRSDPKIIEWVNATFSKQFPQYEDIVSGGIVFSPSIPALYTGTGVEISTDFVTLETEGQQVVHWIQMAKSIHPKGSIALLVRSRAHLKGIFPCLKEQNIAYQGVDIERLVQHPLLQDLMILMRALLHLGDRLAWLSLFRTPWCELSLNDLWIVANYEPRLPVWWALTRIIKEKNKSCLSVYALDRLSYIVPILERALFQRDRLTVSEWVKATWMALTEKQGYRIEDENLGMADQFFSTLAEYRYSTNINIAQFENKLSRLSARPAVVDTQAVQLMTVHKAKGLEFDTVILAGLGRRQKAQSNPLLRWEHRASYLKDPYFMLAPIQSIGKKESPIYKYLKQEALRREQFEATRLLYVASTRAKKRLHWLVHETGSDDTADSGI